MALRICAPHLLLAAGMLLTAAPASAQEGVLFKNLMESVIGGGKNEIEYRQRPPLVVPPSTALPRPQEPGSARTAAWPNDPDVAKRREQRANALMPATEREKWRENQRPLLSQEELRKGRVAGRDGYGPSNVGTTTYEENIGPIRIGRDLAARKQQDNMDKLVYGTEPERQYLYEPPVGYRRPAGSAPLGPGRGGPREDTQAIGQLEFATGRPAPTIQ